MVLLFWSWRKGSWINSRKAFRKLLVKLNTLGSASRKHMSQARVKLVPQCVNLVLQLIYVCDILELSIAGTRRPFQNLPSSSPFHVFTAS